jgi:hypothetical protein
VGSPHDIGAWAYAIRRGEELLGGGKGVDRPQSVTSRLAAEAAALALGLEDLAREWEGEDVVVRTASAGLEGLLLRGGRGFPRDVSLWYSRVCQAAAGPTSVRILPATPEDLAALRADIGALLPHPSLHGVIARASELPVMRKGRA